MLKPRQIGVEPCLIYFLKFGFNQLDSWFWTLVKPMPKGFLYHFGSDLLQSNDPLGILVAGCQRFRRRSAPGESCHLPWPEKPPTGPGWSTGRPGQCQVPRFRGLSLWCRCGHCRDRLRIGSHRGLPGCSDASWKIWRCCPSGRDRRGPSRSWSRIGWCSPEG